MNGEMRGKMAVITIKIQNKDGMTLSVARGEDEAALVYTKEYEEGDEIIFEISPKKCLLRTDGGRCARGGNRLCDRGRPLQDSVRGERFPTRPRHFPGTGI